jgi:hypothetical protein
MTRESQEDHQEACPVAEAACDPEKPAMLSLVNRCTDLIAQIRRAGAAIY